MKIIGVTGGVGSGKSRILDILKEEYGAQIVQADDLAKQLMEPGEEGYQKLIAVYGAQFLNGDGSIDRPSLAKLMFHDPSVLETVNGIIHPLVWNCIREWIDQSKSPLLVVEAALPDENQRDIYTELWYVYTSEENRMKRLLKGRGYTREKSRQVMDHQLTEQQFRAIADVVIDNNGSLLETGRQIASQLDR